MHRVKLYEGAQEKSYYKYFDAPLEPIGKQEEYDLTHLVGDPDRAVEFSDRAVIQTPGYDPEPDGCYFLASGGLLITSVVETPGITADSANWWFSWHQLDPLRYSLWNPEDHYDITISDKTRRRILDQSIPLDRRSWGTSDLVLESMNGEEPSEIGINFCAPGELGFDLAAIGTDSCMAMVCSNDHQQMGPFDDMPVFMAEGLRKDGKGRVVWVAHWWIGCGVDGNGEDTCVEIPDPIREKMAPTAAMLLVHSRKEMRHLSTIMPDLYAENKDNWLE
ncbi:MAG: hypothetical protein PHR15_07180 [Atopobiaceae bacterium]|jgi:hypothetical protein|nr:hypothetical protein [Atopobiaceae bacterium]MCH4180490.1 hypothetical protein [Atopobiaceae bacterium]MCH4214184.1 hypothetical protein [Atopobiaceae bacterium]MCH4229471.1 hypothetical protein [Atopobiaceae bacterium]MCH4275850.1 hypothetical protein [Atopobiaceae bacterium]